MGVLTLARVRAHVRARMHTSTPPAAGVLVCVCVHVCVCVCVCVCAGQAGRPAGQAGIPCGGGLGGHGRDRVGEGELREGGRGGGVLGKEGSKVGIAGGVGQDAPPP